jgi:glycosyltransferase involved in cell wall biosynthesis
MEPTSILLSRCEEYINNGDREASINLLLNLSERVHGETSQKILTILKSKHKIRFQQKIVDRIISGKKICGIFQTKEFRSVKVIDGGRRVRPNITAYKFKPKVSIITVNRNCAQGLEKTIQSVINQSKGLEYQIEHIIIDGASTDHSVDIIRKYENEIDYWLSEPDSGIYSAMNKGLSYAQGDVIAFLNSDDTYLSHATKVSVENLDRNCVDISYGAFAYVKSDGRVAFVDGPRHWDHSMLIMGIPGGHETLFVRKEVYDLVGGYREDFRIVSDYDWMIRAYLAGFSARPVHSVLLQMTMGGASSDQIIEKRECLRLMTDYLGEVDGNRLEELYSWKYYFNWKGYAKSDLSKIRLLAYAEALEDCESTYSKALVKTINQSGEAFKELISSVSNVPKPGKQRICIAVTHLNSIVGGAERIAIEAANRLVEQGHAVTIVCCHGRSGEPFYKVDDRIRFIDIASKPIREIFYDVGDHRWENSWQQITKILSPDEIKDLRDWLMEANSWKVLVYRGFFQRNDFDLVISHMPSTYPYIALALVGEPAPPKHIACLHNSPAFKFYSELYPARSPAERGVRLATLKLCSHISVLYEEYICELPVCVQSKATVLPNFISGKFFENSSPSISKGRKNRIVTVGRLALQKDQKKLIDAFVLIKHQISDWKVEIYGEGPLRLELEQYCVLKGLDPESILLGRTENPKAIYESAGIFVLPSRFEGAPLVLMEAMASGIPVVGFEDCPGVKFMIEHGVNGLLAERDEDSRELSNVILKLINDQSLRDTLARNGLETSKTFKVDRHIEKIGYFFKPEDRRVSSEIRNAEFGNNKFNVAVVSHTTSGSLGINAVRLRRGLQRLGISTCIFSTEKDCSEPSIVLKPDFDDHLLVVDIGRPVNHEEFKTSCGRRLAQETTPFWESQIRAIASYDIIILHNVGDLLSPESIQWLLECGKPLIWILCNGFQVNSTSDSNLSWDHLKFVCQAKLLRDRITFVVPCQWFATEAKNRKEFEDFRVEVIPDGIDTAEFQACDKNRAKAILELPQDKKLILFGCQNYSDLQKGFQEVLKALIFLNRSRQDLHFVTFGVPLGETDWLPLSITAFQEVSSSSKLSMIYSACDVTVLPSLDGNFRNIILESLSCGTPIAAFNARGIVDLVQDGVTGHLALSNNFFELASAVERCLNGNLSKSCREFAVDHLDITKQAECYGKLFSSLVSQETV